MDPSRLTARTLAWGLAGAVILALAFIPLPKSHYRPPEQMPPGSIWPPWASRPKTREEGRFLQCLTSVMLDHGITLAAEDRARALASFRDSHPINDIGAPRPIDRTNRRGYAIARATEKSVLTKYGCVLH